MRSDSNFSILIIMDDVVTSVERIAQQPEIVGVLSEGKDAHASITIV